jgi:Ca2+-transporting ATPase
MTIGSLVAYQIGEDQWDALTATTMLLTTLSLYHLAAGVLARDQIGTIFDRDFVPGATQLRRYAVSFIAIVLVTSLDILQRIFDTTSLDLSAWSICVGLALALVVVEEIVKWVLRHRRHDPVAVAPATAPVTA